MGTLRYPPLTQFALRLRDELRISDFVETGTYQGETTSWAAEHFENVYTIEICERFQLLTMDKYKALTNITYHLGDTRTALPRVLETAVQPTMFWLDAHNASKLFSDGPDDCPILDELALVFTRSPNAAILIDDAHCFIPPLPHDPKEWPELWRIKAVAAQHGYLCSVNHDVIALLPESQSALLAEFGGKDDIEAAKSANRAAGQVYLSPSRHQLGSNLTVVRNDKLSVRATAQQGITQPPIDQVLKLDDKSITEVVNTTFGPMLVPRFDVNQTPALRGGYPLSHAEIQMLVRLMKKCKSDPWFLDIGANVGTFSFAMQPLCHRIHAFEAQRIIYNMLCGSVALMGHQNILCHCAAVSDTTGGWLEVPQFDYSKVCSFGSIEFGEEQIEPLHQTRQHDPAKQEFVSTVSIDSFGFPRVDMIKMDIEGMEELAILGAQETLKLYHPILYIEFNKAGGSIKLMRLLQTFGYFNMHELGTGDMVVLPEGFTAD